MSQTCQTKLRVRDGSTVLYCAVYESGWEVDI